MNSASEREKVSSGPIKLDDRLLIDSQDIAPRFNILKPASDQNKIPNDIANKLSQLQMEVEDHEKQKATVSLDQKLPKVHMLRGFLTQFDGKQNADKIIEKGVEF